MTGITKYDTNSDFESEAEKKMDEKFNNDRSKITQAEGPKYDANLFKNGDDGAAQEHAKSIEKGAVEVDQNEIKNTGFN